MSELISEPIATIEYAISPDAERADHMRTPDHARLVSAAALLLRWLLETLPDAKAGDRRNEVSHAQGA